MREFHRYNTGCVGKCVQEGDLVTVYGEGKRGNWRLARVEELIIGKDEEVRGAKVRVTGEGRPVYLKRPLQKLYIH